jgi:hypothetical protein
MSRLKTLLILVLACSFVACTSGPQPAPDTEKAPAGVALIPRAAPRTAPGCPIWPRSTGF